MQSKFISIAAASAALVFAPAAQAELPRGARAPVFTTQGALGGKAFAFNLRAALRKGPVVLYFYPKSFTEGCTLEAHAFAEAMGEFRANGATVIGLSADDLATQQRFSKEACRDAFPVGVASGKIAAAYDVVLKHPGAPAGMTTRTSYVIGQDGRIKLAFTDMNYRDHVRMTLQSVQALRAKPAR